MINIIKKIKLIGILFEDFINYKVPSMTLAFPYCSMKCNKEYGECICQNNELCISKNIKEFDIDSIILHYTKNDITKAFVFMGMEPLDSFDEVIGLIDQIRKVYDIKDDIIIYTGYNKDEIEDKIEMLRQYSNIIIKFGRYIPDQEKHYDSILGINLASDNQYSEKIS